MKKPQVIIKKKISILDENDKINSDQNLTNEKVSPKEKHIKYKNKNKQNKTNSTANKINVIAKKNNDVLDNNMDNYINNIRILSKEKKKKIDADLYKILKQDQLKILNKKENSNVITKQEGKKNMKRKERKEEEKNKKDKNNLNLKSDKKVKEQLLIDDDAEEIIKLNKENEKNWENIIEMLGIQEEKLGKNKKKLKTQEKDYSNKKFNNFQMFVSTGDIQNSIYYLQTITPQNISRGKIDTTSNDESIKASFNNKSYVTRRILEATLGNKNLRNAVKTPENCNEFDWVASLSYQCYKETEVCCSVIWEECKCNIISNDKIACKYTVADEYKKNLNELAVVQNIENIIFFCFKAFKNTYFFPIDPNEDYPSDFKLMVTKICWLLLQIYEHIYRNHLNIFLKHEAVAHLNCLFKHFLYFSVEFNLLTETDFLPLKNLVNTFLGVRGNPIDDWKGLNPDNFKISILMSNPNEYKNLNCLNNDNINVNTEEKIKKNRKNEKNKNNFYLNTTNASNEEKKNDQNNRNHFEYLENVQVNDKTYDTLNELLKHVCTHKQ